MIYQVPLYPQRYRMSCWAASIAMIYGFRNSVCISDDAVADETNRKKQLTDGLNPSDSGPLDYYGFGIEAPMCYAADTFHSLIRQFGPLWVAAAVPSPHVRVVRGSRANSGSYELFINDPGPVGRGGQYSVTYEDFMAQMETLGGQEAGEPSPVYVAYLAASAD